MYASSCSQGAKPPANKSLQHTVCDGTGNLVFYSVLAQHISAATTGQALDPLTDSAISLLDRKSVINPEADVLLGDFPDWKLVQETDQFLNPCDYDPTKSPPVRFATYFVSEDNLRSLRQSQSTESGHAPSSTEAVCAFLWKHVVIARGTDCVKYPETKLSVTVNTRTRMTDPICSPAYWGNLSEPNAVSEASLDDRRLQSSLTRHPPRWHECPLAPSAKPPRRRHRQPRPPPAPPHVPLRPHLLAPAHRHRPHLPSS
jgi:hypothetical protein